MDELPTGVPMLAAPDDERLMDILTDPDPNKTLTGREGREYFADWNHIFHPRFYRLLVEGDGPAIRGLRAQLLLRKDHDAYHGKYAGPILPTTDAERFRVIVFCLAGYIPRKAMSFKDGGPDTVTLSNEQIARLHNGPELRVMESKGARDFLRRYVFENVLNVDMPKQKVDEFIALGTNCKHDSEPVAVRRQWLARQLLQMLVDPLTDPLAEAYKEARGDKLWVRRESAGPRHLVPKQMFGQHPRVRKKEMDRTSRQLRLLLSKNREGSLEAGHVPQLIAQAS